MERILFIRGGAVGDFVLTLPILEALASSNIACKVEILGYSRIAELAVGRRYAINVRDIGRAEWAPLFLADGELRDSERAWLAGFDRVFCVWPDKDGVICNNLMRAGARHVVSLDPTPSDGMKTHIIEQIAVQCEKAGLSLLHREPHLYPSERDRWWAERHMRVTRAGEERILGIHPGSGSVRKNWPAHCFAEVGKYWIKRHYGNVLIFAGPADIEPLCEIQGFLSGERIFIVQDEPLPCVAAILERCDVFVGNDSGISHIAAAVRTPTVAIFGPTDPTLWRPFASRVSVVLSHKVDLSALSVETVITKMEDLLKGP